MVPRKGSSNRSANSSRDNGDKSKSFNDDSTSKTRMFAKQLNAYKRSNASLVKEITDMRLQRKADLDKCQYYSRTNLAQEQTINVLISRLKSIEKCIQSGMLQSLVQVSTFATNILEMTNTTIHSVVDDIPLTPVCQTPPIKLQQMPGSSRASTSPLRRVQPMVDGHTICSPRVSLRRISRSPMQQQQRDISTSSSSPAIQTLVVRTNQSEPEAQGDHHQNDSPVNGSRETDEVINNNSLADDNETAEPIAEHEDDAMELHEPEERFSNLSVNESLEEISASETLNNEPLQQLSTISEESTLTRSNSSTLVANTTSYVNFNVRRPVKPLPSVDVTEIVGQVGINNIIVADAPSECQDAVTSDCSTRANLDSVSFLNDEDSLEMSRIFTPDNISASTPNVGRITKQASDLNAGPSITVRRGKDKKTLSENMTSEPLAVSSRRSKRTSINKRRSRSLSPVISPGIKPAIDKTSVTRRTTIRKSVLVDNGNIVPSKRSRLTVPKRESQVTKTLGIVLEEAKKGQNSRGQTLVKLVTDLDAIENRDSIKPNRRRSRSLSPRESTIGSVRSNSPRLSDSVRSVPKSPIKRGRRTVNVKSYAEPKLSSKLRRQ